MVVLHLYFSMYKLSWIFKNTWMQLHVILNLTHLLYCFTANQNLHNTFPAGSHKSTVSIMTLSRTCNGAKLCEFVVDAFAVTTNHLVG